MEMALKEMKSNIPLMIDLGVQVSKLLREYYNALIKEGFTEQQALQIVINHGVSYGFKQSTNQE